VVLFLGSRPSSLSPTGCPCNHPPAHFSPFCSCKSLPDPCRAFRAMSAISCLHCRPFRKDFQHFALTPRRTTVVFDSLSTCLPLFSYPPISTPVSGHPRPGCGFFLSSRHLFYIPFWLPSSGPMNGDESWSPDLCFSYPPTRPLPAPFSAMSALS